MKELSLERMGTANGGCFFAIPKAIASCGGLVTVNCLPSLTFIEFCWNS